MKLHEFFPPLKDVHAAQLARGSGKRLALEVSGERDGVTVAVCVGPLSDAFRTAFYGPVVDAPLPEERATDAEFSDFLVRARKATDGEFAAMLAER